MLNHWPLMLLAVAFFILLIGEYRQYLPYKKLGLILLILAAVIALPVQFSGEGAEHVLEEMGVAEHDMIERHESVGFFSAVLAYILGVLAFISLLMLHNIHAFFGYLRRLILVLAGAGMILMAIAAHTGGEIRHPEIRFSQPAG